MLAKAPFLLIAAQLTVTLLPQTVQQFEEYATTVESQLNSRWQGMRPFLELDEDAAGRQAVLDGKLYIREMSSPSPLPIRDGLVHDWLGTVFIPHTDMPTVLKVLQDFDHHKNIYPEVVESHLIERNGNDVKGYWRLQRKQLLATVVLDVRQEAHYQDVGQGRWICRAYAKNISEMDDVGRSNEHKLPPGEEHGYLWRLYAYWSLEPTQDGVLAECRTISLSRDVPPGLVWAVKPFLQTMPHDSLASTLKSTRDAVMKSVHALPKSASTKRLENE